MGHTVASLARRVAELEQAMAKLKWEVSGLKDMEIVRGVIEAREEKNGWKKGLSADMYEPIPLEEYGGVFCEVDDCPTTTSKVADVHHAQWRLNPDWEDENDELLPKDTPEYLCSIHYFELVNYDPNESF